MQQLKVPCGEDNSDVLQLVKQWLEAEHHKPWLMVIDNVDDLNLFYGTSGLSRYLPACAQGKLLITTRNRQVAIRATKGRGFIEIQRMTESEAQELLGTHLGCLEPDVADLSTLALKLEYLPLILVQAAAFIQENSIPIREYLNLLENDDDLIELLNEDFETSGRDPDSLRAVAKTWAISFRQIQRQNKLAGDLLALISMFNHQHIPESFLVAYLSSTYSQEKPLERLKAIGLLKAFSVVSSAQDNSISMHRLIQLVMRRWLFQEGTVESFLQKAIVTINSESSSILDEYRWTQIEHRLVHITTIISVSQSAKAAKLLRCTNTFDMLKLASLRFLQHTFLRIVKDDFEEKELIRAQEAEINASLSVQDLMRKLSSGSHLLNKDRTMLTNSWKMIMARWGRIGRPGTSDMFSDELGRWKTDVQGCSSGRSG